jgi:hypothetical protein
MVIYSSNHVSLLSKCSQQHTLTPLDLYCVPGYIDTDLYIQQKVEEKVIDDGLVDVLED